MNEAYFGTVLDNSHHLYVVVDPESLQILLANCGASKFTGLSQEELEQSYLQDLIIDFGTSGIAEVLQQLVSNPVPANPFIVKVKPGDGECRWARAFAQAISFQDKLAACITIVPGDSASQETIERERNLERGFQRMKIFNWTIDVANGERMFLGNGFEHFGLDFTSGPLTIDNILEKVHEEDREQLRQALENIKQGSEISSIEFRIFHGAYGWSWVYTNLERETNEFGELVRINGTLQDITDRKVSEDVRRMMSKKMQEGQKYESLGMLAGGIAHEFNNILTGILGNANLARMQLEPESRLESHLEQIETSAIRAAELCKQMLAYAGKGKYFVQPQNINNLLRDCKQLLKLSVNKGIIVDFCLKEGLPNISADATQIRQIFLNLVTNASDAIGHRSGVIRLSTGMQRVTSHDASTMIYSPESFSGDFVFLEVEDNGVGLTEPAQEKLFDPFFSTKPGGRGLGLAAVLGIVRAHQGAIQVSSELGAGTKIKILLPAVAQIAETSRVIASDLDAQGDAILVVDDEETVAIVTVRMLESFGLRTQMVNSGEQAVELYRSNPEFSAVILDLTMPRMNGVETYHALKEIDPAIQVLLMSGFTEQESMQQFRNEGISGFLQKPFTTQQLKQLLNEVLDLDLP